MVQRGVNTVPVCNGAGKVLDTTGSEPQAEGREPGWSSEGAWEGHQEGV